MKRRTFLKSIATSPLLIATPGYTECKIRKHVIAIGPEGIDIADQAKQLDCKVNDNNSGWVRPRSIRTIGDRVDECLMAIQENNKCFYMDPDHIEAGLADWSDNAKSHLTHHIKMPLKAGEILIILMDLGWFDESSYGAMLVYHARTLGVKPIVISTLPFNFEGELIREWSESVLKGNKKLRL